MIITGTYYCIVLKYRVMNYTEHYLKRRECQSHIQKYWRMSLRGSNGFSLATEKRGVKVSLHCLFKNVVATAVVRSQLG